MSRMRNTGNFFISLLISMAFNLDRTIPAWIVLICHFWLGQPPMWVFWALIGIWFVIILAWLLVMIWAGTAKPLPPQKNKNPYSSNAPVNRPASTHQVNAATTEIKENSPRT